MGYTLNEAIYYLIQKPGAGKSFWASVLNGCHRVPSEKVRLMGVGIHRGKLVLFYNPRFMSEAPLAEIVATVEHEGIHVVMDHIPRFLEFLSHFKEKEDRKRAIQASNIALDFADNCLLRKSPDFRPVDDGHVFPWLMPEMDPFKLPADKAAEWYLAELMKDEHQEGVKKITGSDHGMWLLVDEHGNLLDADGNPLTPDEIKSLGHRVRTQLKQLLKEVRDDFKKGRGLIPAGVDEWLDEYLRPPIVPWWQYFQQLITNARLTKPKRSIERPNRMLMAMAEDAPFVLPSIGRSYDPSFNIIYMEDTSGSMGIEELQITRSELHNIMRTDDEIRVRHLQGDAAVHYDKLLTGTDEITKSVIGRGGTSAEAYFQYIWKYVDDADHRPDLVIIATDGYVGGVSDQARLPPEIPVIWLVTPDRYGHGETSAAAGLRKEGYGEVLVADPSHRHLYNGQG